MGSVTGILLTPLLLVALCSAAPYEVQSSTSAPAVGAPEKLVEAVRSVHCSVQYVTIWDTKYEEQPFEVCETVYQQLCEVKSQRLCQNTTREECFTTYKSKTHSLITGSLFIFFPFSSFLEVCVDEYKTVLEPYTETECVTTYKEDCEYHWEVVGKEKVWAPIPGSCKTNPYDECHDVEKTHSKQVAYPVCHEVPEKKCYYVPEQVCKSEPFTKCREIPQEVCRLQHKRVPVRISKSIPKKVCDTVGSHQDFFPVPAVPVQGLVPAATLPVQPTTLAPVDIINRNDESTFAFSNDNSVEAENTNVQEFDKFVFENNSNVNFEE